MNVLIRRAKPSDFSDVFPLLQQLWPFAELNKESLKNTFEIVVGANSDFALCLLSGDTIRGFVAGSFVNDFWHSGLVCRVSTLVIDSSARRQHFGSALMDSVKALAIQNQCKAIELDSALHREQAHSFYEKYGFIKRALAFTLDL